MTCNKLLTYKFSGRHANKYHSLEHTKQVGRALQLAKPFSAKCQYPHSSARKVLPQQCLPNDLPLGYINFRVFAFCKRRFTASSHYMRPIRGKGACFCRVSHFTDYFQSISIICLSLSLLWDSGLRSQPNQPRIYAGSFHVKWILIKFDILLWFSSSMAPMHDLQSSQCYGNDVLPKLLALLLTYYNINERCYLISYRWLYISTTS